MIRHDGRGMGVEQTAESMPNPPWRIIWKIVLTAGGNGLAALRGGLEPARGRKGYRIGDVGASEHVIVRHNGYRGNQQ